MSLKMWIGLGVAITTIAALSDKSSKPQKTPKKKKERYYEPETNEHDAEKEIFRAFPMPDDNTKASKKTHLVDLKCMNCGGKMKWDTRNSRIDCPYCDSSKMMIDSDAVKISKKKYDTYEQVERGKQNAYSQIAIEREKTKQKDSKNFTIAIIALLVLPILGMIPLVYLAMNEPDHNNEIQIPSAAKDYLNKDVFVTVKALKALGFDDIEAEPLGDLTTGWINKENSIESIYINGDSTFTAHTWFPSDAQISIYYHSFDN